MPRRIQKPKPRRREVREIEHDEQPRATDGSRRARRREDLLRALDELLAEVDSALRAI